MPRACEVPRVYHLPVRDLTVFVLAGGKSSRMGTDKALLEFDGQTLLARALNLASALAPDPRIVGEGEKYFRFGRVVEDIYPGRGPLGGIHAALAGTATELNLMLAVDLPFMQLEFLRYLVAQASRVSVLATVPRVARGWQPLCGVYRRDFCAAAEVSLQKGKNKIDPLFDDVETRVITEEEIERMGFSLEMFHNLNTRDDLERAKIQRAESRPRT